MANGAFFKAILGRYQLIDWFNRFAKKQSSKKQFVGRRQIF